MSETQTTEEIHPKITYRSETGQRLILVMAALDSLGGENSKEETIQCIFNKGWYKAEKGDYEVYESTGEPKIKNWLAWERKHAVMRGWISNDQRDSWALSREGQRVFELCQQKFTESKRQLSECFLWSRKFKQRFDPKHEPSENDKPRPPRQERGQVTELDDSILKQVFEPTD